MHAAETQRGGRNSKSAISDTGFFNEKRSSLYHATSKTKKKMLTVQLASAYHFHLAHGVTPPLSSGDEGQRQPHGAMTRAESPLRWGALTPVVMKTAIHGRTHLLRTTAPAMPRGHKAGEHSRQTTVCNLSLFHVKSVDIIKKFNLDVSY